MLVDKERVREYYRRLKEDFPDLCHEDIVVAEEWVRRAKNLRLVGAWFHYMVLIRKSKDYVKKNCPCYLERLEWLLRRVGNGRGLGKE